MDRATAALAVSILALVMAGVAALAASSFTGELGVTNFDQIELDAKSTSAPLDIDQSGSGPLFVARKNGTPVLVVNATGVPIFAQAPATMTPTPTRTPTVTPSVTPTP